MRVWVSSLIFYTSIFAVCELLRRLIDYLAMKCYIRRTLVGTLQLCVPMFDVNLILETYGLLGVFIEIAIIEFANACLLLEAIAHPCPLITTSAKKRKAVRRIACVFLVQLFGAYLSYFCARLYWRLRLHEKYNVLYEAQYCDADLAVTITSGCLIEGMATFAIKAIEYYMEENYQSEFYRKTMISSLLSGFITALGITYTGMYANPIVAWACTFNCKGATHVAHLAVYWLSPLVGWYFAEAVFGETDCDIDTIFHEEIETTEKIK